MKYCLTYRPNKEQLMSKADELSINFNRSDTTLPEFLEKYRIVDSNGDVYIIEEREE